MFSVFRKYTILNSFPNLSSGSPSPFSSITSRSSLSYHSHAAGINTDNDSFLLLKFFFTASVAYIWVVNFWRVSSPIFESFSIVWNRERGF